MVGCGIRNCKNRSGNADMKIKFFRLPRNKSVAQKWLRYCKPIPKLDNVRICQHHFIPSDFTKSLYHTLLNLAPERVRTLKPDAIPSQHIEDSGGPPDATPTQEIDNISTSPDAKPTQEINNITRSSDAKPTQEIDNISRLPDAKPTKQTVTFMDTPVKLESDPDPLPTQGIDDSKTNLHRLHFTTSILKNNNNEKSKGPLAPKGVEENTKSNIEHNYSKINQLEEKCYNTSPKIEYAGSSKIVESVVIPLTEYKKLKNTVNKYNILKKNLEKIFTPGQIRSLMTLDKRRVQWSPEDISAAIALKTISPNGYRYLRHTVGVPLPAFSTLRQWTSVNRNKEVVITEQEETEEAAIPSEVVCLGTPGRLLGHNRRGKRRRPGKPKKMQNQQQNQKNCYSKTDPAI